MDFLSKVRILIVSLILALLISVFCVPAGADARIATSSKVFFEKNGVPYNDSVSFTVTCYGFTYTYTDPDSKKYLSGDYEKRAPGSDNQTEVFSYSATVDHYGDEIFEPFYLNYRVIDYCSLCGETDRKKFYTENVGDTPIPNCSRRLNLVYFERETDVCRLNTNETRECFEDQNELRDQEWELCDQYLEKFDKNKNYPPDTRTMEIGGVTMVITPEYDECYEKARLVDLNCTNYMIEVPCEDYCDPEGNPLERDCSLKFEIPADADGNIIEDVNIIEPEPEPEEAYTYYIEDKDLSEGGFSLVSLIYEFLGFWR